MSFLSTLLKIERHAGLWFSIFLLTSASMAVALYYQYALEWEPCVLCIHIRIIMFALMVLSLTMTFLTRFQIPRILGFIGQSILATYLFLKCRELYRVEIGLQDAECMFNAGLPNWFNLEAWLPAIFEVRSACGESPELMFNISMAEALYTGSAFAMVAALILLALSLFGLFKRR